MGHSVKAATYHVMPLLRASLLLNIVGICDRIRLMQTAYSKEDLRNMLAPRRGGRVVLVPTMGALHEGHASLLRQARALAGDSGCVVASVFLNPVQFDNAGDLAAYPQTPEADLELCRSCGVDVVFMPTPQMMLPLTRPQPVSSRTQARMFSNTASTVDMAAKTMKRKKSVPFHRKCGNNPASFSYKHLLS